MIIVAAILFAALSGWWKTSQTAFEREACRNSVLQQSIVKKAPDIISSGIRLASDCPTFDITFYEDHVEKTVVANDKTRTNDYIINQPGKKGFKKFDALNDEIVNYVVAEELAGCWYQFLEGKKNIFLDEYWYKNDWNDNENLCFVCSNFQFDFQEVEQDTFTGFYDFLQYARKRNVGGTGYVEQTYYDYVIDNSRQCNNYENELSGLMNSNLDINKAYQTFFTDMYGYSFSDSQTYSSIDNLPPSACWNLFIDGVQKLTIQGKYSPPQYAIEPVAEFQRNIDFNKESKYSVVMVRRGKDKEDESYFAYVLPQTKLNNLCDQLAI